MSADFDHNYTADSTSADPTNPSLRFEIISAEWDTGEGANRCNHQPVLDLLNDVLDRLAEVASMLEIVALSLSSGGGN